MHTAEMCYKMQKKGFSQKMVECVKKNAHLNTILYKTEVRGSDQPSKTRRQFKTRLCLSLYFFLNIFRQHISIFNEENIQTPVLGNQATPVLLLADNLATGPFKGVACP